MKWSEEAWNSIEPIFNEILSLPFIKELQAGTLPDEKFLFYLHQDSMYLSSYGQVLAHIASRMPDASFRAKLLGFATDGVAVERDLHQTFLKGSEDISSPQSPICLFYTSYLKSQAYSAVEVEMASVLPCFWIYQRVGKFIYDNSCRDMNPYKQWIETYADPYFEVATESAVAIYVTNSLLIVHRKTAD